MAMVEQRIVQVEANTNKPFGHDTNLNYPIDVKMIWCNQTATNLARRQLFPDGYLLIPASPSIFFLLVPVHVFHMHPNRTQGSAIRYKTLGNVAEARRVQLET